MLYGAKNHAINNLEDNNNSFSGENIVFLVPHIILLGSLDWPHGSACLITEQTNAVPI